MASCNLYTMSDLLSAASLILAVVGILYGLWYPEIQKVLEKKVPTHVEDRGTIYREISSTLWSRSLPLTFLAIMIFLIFLPDTIKYILEISSQISTGGFSKFISDYNAVSTAFCAVEFLTINIGIFTLVLSIKLIIMRCRR
jgi:hypothetical protein